MLGKNKNNQAITKKELRQELGDFTEEVLLPSMQEIFITKKGFKQVLGQKLDEKLKPMKKEILREILDGQDKVCKQLTDLQTESESGTKIYNRNKKKIEDHEERIGSLELKPL